MPDKVDNLKYKHLTKPNQHALKLLAIVLEQNPAPELCEVGVGFGATTIEICRMLSNRGIYHLFEFSDRLDDLKKDLDGSGFNNIVYHSNTRRQFDSYSWVLAQMLLARRAGGGPVPMFDFVFLDGAHAFHHDAPATVILKELLKPGGIFLFDDYDWTFGASPTQRPAVKPEILKLYTEEQIQTPHLRLICDLFMDSDPDYEKVNLNFVGRERRRAYRKHAGG